MEKIEKAIDQLQNMKKEAETEKQATENKIREATAKRAALIVKLDTIAAEGTDAELYAKTKGEIAVCDAVIEMNQKRASMIANSYEAGGEKMKTFCDLKNQIQTENAARIMGVYDQISEKLEEIKTILDDCDSVTATANAAIIETETALGIIGKVPAKSPCEPFRSCVIGREINNALNTAKRCKAKKQKFSGGDPALIA